MNPEQLDKLVECLESVRKRPSMYFGQPDVEAAAHFLHGFQIALRLAFGVDRDFDLWKQILESRGWTDIPYYLQMVKRGMSPLEVINELVGIEIELLQRVTANASQRASNEGQP